MFKISACVAAVFVAGLITLACSSSGLKSRGGTAGSGGGGQAGSKPDAGYSSGGERGGTGGDRDTSSGGGTVVGGTVGSGGATGSSATTGGVRSTGGVSATGGTVADTGGTVRQGGATASGGVAGSTIVSSGGMGGAGGNRSSGEVPGTGGTAGQGGSTSGEYVDATGRCVRSMEFGSAFCPTNYADALKLHDPCGTACAGPVGGLLIYMDYCAPSHGCAYAADSKLLVGYQLANDSPSYCSNKAAISYGGQFPSTVTFGSLDLNENCPKQ